MTFSTAFPQSLLFIRLVSLRLRSFVPHNVF